MVDRYEELYRSFRWNVPERYNMARACCGNWAADRGRFALYWEDESGAMAAYSFWDLQQAANRLSNALAALGVKRGDRVAIILPQRPETVIAYIAVFQMGAVALHTALRLAAGEKIASRHIELATELVVRGSSLAV